MWLMPNSKLNDDLLQQVAGYGCEDRASLKLFNPSFPKSKK
jgi:hypothetical protein